MKNLFYATGIILGVVVFAILVNDKHKGKENKSEKVIRASAKSMHSEIKFPAGVLNIYPSEKGKFFSSDYHNCDELMKPQTDFIEDGNKANLRITAPQSDNKNINYNDSCNCTWNLYFNKKVENNISITMIAGQGNIDLSDCKLEAIDFKMTAGEVNLNLKNTSLPYLNFRAAAGNVELNLTGEWNNDLRADIKGGVGEINIKIPDNIGVKVEISGLLGDIDAPSFTKKNKTYTNQLYGKTDETLYLDILGGIGSVNIKTVHD